MRCHAIQRPNLSQRRGSDAASSLYCLKKHNTSSICMQVEKCPNQATQCSRPDLERRAACGAACVQPNTCRARRQQPQIPLSRLTASAVVKVPRVRHGTATVTAALIPPHLQDTSLAQCQRPKCATERRVRLGRLNLATKSCQEILSAFANQSKRMP